MKYYTITVNGNTYEVSVEENNKPFKTPVATPAAVVSPSPNPVTPQAAPAPVKEEVVAAPAVTGTTGKVQVASPMPGKIIAAKVTVGQTVKKGDVVLILEAMKMENEIVAPQEGTIASIDVVAGQSVQAGDLLATMN